MLSSVLFRTTCPKRRFEVVLRLGALAPAGWLFGVARAAKVHPVSADDLFRSPLVEQVSLSPKGDYLAAITAEENGSDGLLIYDLARDEAKGLKGHDEYDIYSYRWIDEDHLLYNVSQDKRFALGLFVARRDALGQPVALNQYDVTQLISVPKLRPQRAVIWIEQSAYRQGQPGDAEEISTEMVMRSPIGDPMPYDPVIHRFTPPPGTVFSWLANYDGDLALCFAYADARSHVYWRDQQSGTWRELPIDLKQTTILSVDPDGHSLWVSAYDSAAGFEVRPFDTRTNTLGKAILTDREYNPGQGRLYYSAKSRKPVGLVYEQARLRSVWFAQPFKTIQATLDHQLPNTDNELVDFDDAEQHFLYASTSPQQSRRYFVVDIGAHTMRAVTAARPWLKGDFAPTQSIRVATRDGLKLDAYLTLPKGASATHPAPLVVLAHGGPAVRDIWTFDPEVQFLATRGYAVLQPNYRGSFGYAPNISKSTQFDPAVCHEDVTDATKAMFGNPAIDPHRVAIMGASFGGYLALAGVTFDPDLYRCAITTCGIFDWEAMVKDRLSNGRPAEYERLRDRLGRPGKDSARFAEISPLDHADNVRVPVFIAHGNNDHIVNVSQSKRLASVLKQRGVPVQTFFRPLEGHGFYNDGNRIEYYREVAGFLDKYLR